MPKFDGTGPAGFGPMSGWSHGCCVQPGWRAYPRYGWGGGYGRGWRHRFWASGVPERMWHWSLYDYPYFTAEDEIEWLKRESQFLEKELEAIRKRIEELERKTTNKKAEK